MTFAAARDENADSFSSSFTVGGLEGNLEAT